jgi:hypothetical protein
MAFALLIIGAVLLISAVRNTVDGPSGLFALVRNDFTGQANFIYWIAAILIIGAIGYIPKLKSLSVAMLGLVVLVLFLKKGDPTTGVGGGFFAQFVKGIGATTTAPVTASSTLPAPVPGANAPGFNQPGSIINDPLGYGISQPATPVIPASGLDANGNPITPNSGGNLSFPYLPPITPLVQ